MYQYYQYPTRSTTRTLEAGVEGLSHGDWSFGRDDEWTCPWLTSPRPRFTPSLFDWKPAESPHNLVNY